MLTALDAPLDALDDHEQKFVATIREHGWFHTHVLGDAEHSPFNYSTGWWHSINHPEMIVFGISAETSGSILWDIYREVLAGDPLEVGTRTDRAFKNLPAYAFEVSPKFYPEYVGWSRWFYGGDDFRCLQLVWPDRSGRFAWEDGAEPSLAETQPDLTSNGWRAAIRD